MTIEKTKVAHIWENKSISLLLPNGGAWKQLTSWIKNTIESTPISQPDTNSNTTIVDFEKTVNADSVEFTQNELKVYNYIKKQPKEIKRKEIDNAMGWSKSKSEDILKLLISKELVQDNGRKGKAIKYKLNPNKKINIS